MRVKLVAALAIAIACAAMFVANAFAGHTTMYRADGVVPVFCGVVTDAGHSPVFSIPANTVPLTVRLGWGTKSYGQSTNFINGQRLVYTIRDEATGAVLYQRTDPGFGDTSNWSAPTTAVNGSGQYWLTNYRFTTPLTLALNQTVRITYELTADRKTDDGFGFKFEAGQVMSGGNTCTVTGVTPPPPG